MATEKAYTPEQTLTTLAAYAAGKTPEQISEDIGRSKRSVVAKLAKEGVYVSKAATAEPRRMKKSEMVSYIAGYYDLPVEELESLEKATHLALMLLYNAVRGDTTTTKLDAGVEFWFDATASSSRVRKSDLDLVAQRIYNSVYGVKRPYRVRIIT